CRKRAERRLPWHPSGAEARGALDRGVRIAAHPDGRSPTVRFRLRDEAVEAHVAALEPRCARGPELEQCLEVLIGDAASLVERDAEALEFGGEDADADAELEPTFGQLVECCDLF